MPFVRSLDVIVSKGLLWEAANATVAAANASEMPNVMAMLMSDSSPLLRCRAASALSGISRVRSVGVDAVVMDCRGDHIVRQFAVLGEPVQGGDHDVAGIHLEVLA